MTTVDAMSGVNTMMGMQFDMTIINSIMKELNNIANKFSNSNTTDVSFYDIVSDQDALLRIKLTIFNVCISAICLYILKSMTAPLTSFMKLLLTFIKKLLYPPILFIYAYMKKIIFNTKMKYNINRNVSLYTTKLKPNSELYLALNWYLESPLCCKKVSKDLETTINNTKELYIEELTENNNFSATEKKKKKNIMMSNIGSTNDTILYEDHEITFYSEKTIIEINTELELTKRDNFTYYLSTTDENPETNILEKFSLHVLEKYNNHKEPWQQKIYHNNGGQWDNGEPIDSSNDMDSIVLRKEFKKTLINTQKFFKNNKDFYVKNGKRYKRVSIYFGEPGTGKTQCAVISACQNGEHVYAFDPEKSYAGDLDSLIKKMNTVEGILLIDDFDHHFDVEELADTINNNNTFENLESPNNNHNNKTVKNEKKRISAREFLTVFDGVGTKSGMQVIIIINDPSKVDLLNGVHGDAFSRESRINFIGVFELCNREMIKELFTRIFGYEPDSTLIDKIPEDYYAPCVISQQFTNFVEQNAGDISSDEKKKEINNILKDLIDGKIQTNKDIIEEYKKNIKTMKEKRTTINKSMTSANSLPVTPENSLNNEDSDDDY